MKIAQAINSLLLDLDSFQPKTLSDIVFFVKKHNSFGKITMLGRNLDESREYLHKQCLYLSVFLWFNPNPKTDLQLAALLCLGSLIDSSLETKTFEKLLSRTSRKTDTFKWSRAIATSYLLHQEVFCEKLRIPA